MAKWGCHPHRRREEKDFSVLIGRHLPPLRGSPEPERRKQALGRRDEADIREVAGNIKSSAVVSTQASG